MKQHWHDFSLTLLFFYQLSYIIFLAVHTTLDSSVNKGKHAQFGGVGFVCAN